MPFIPKEYFSSPRFLGRNFDPPPLGDPQAAPMRAIIREIDLVPNGRYYDFKFIRYDNTTVVTDLNDLNALVKNLHDDDHQGWHADVPELEWPYSSPLSLSNKDETGRVYIIYLLNKDRNWQFSRKGPPITINTLSNGKGAYMNGFRGKPDGTPVGNSSVLDKCRVAYMMADAHAAFEGLTEYVDRINLHIDMCYKGGPASGPTSEDLYMPIIVDPDVRHPGGSEP